jgi:TRAP transporter 4TM/12TM fusion protein
VTHESDPAPAASLSGSVRWLVAAGATLLTLASFGFALQFYRNVLGLLLFNEQFLAGMLALGLALVYLSQPMRRGAPRPFVPWYDWILATLGLIAGGYLAVRFPTLSEEMTSRPLDGLIVAFIIIPLVIEALRRMVGSALVIVIICFLAYAMVGHLVPGQLAGRPVKLTQLAYYLAWDPGSMLGLPMMVATTIVIAFIFLGQLLFASGGSAFFTDIALALMGRYRGGSAKIAITASSLFGMISGSAVSNVASVGVITIPLMRRGGYPAHIAAAIEAVASTGGQLMPPVMGAAAFLMAEFLQVPYRDVAIAAALPALLYYYALFIQADLLAARVGITRLEDTQIPAIGSVLKRGAHFLLPFVVLIVALFWLNWSPELSALAGAALLVVNGMLIGYGDKRLSLRDIVKALHSTGMASLDLIMITAAAGFIIGVLNITGLSFSLTLMLVHVGSGNILVLLLLAAIVSIVLGMGMPTVGVYVLLATLVAPAMVQVGLSPMASHMFVMYFGMMSMITPPVALAAYAAASLAQTDAMKTGWAAVRFGWIAYIIPFLFVRAPSLLLEGGIMSVVLATLTALAGVWMICAAFAGYSTRPIGWAARIAFGIAGLLMFIPADAIPHGGWTDVAGLVLGAGLIGRDIFAARLVRRAA